MHRVLSAEARRVQGRANCDSLGVHQKLLLEVVFEETAELRLWIQVFKGGERLEIANSCPISEDALVSTERMVGKPNFS